MFPLHYEEELVKEFDYLTAKEYIYKIFDFNDNGIVKTKDDIFYGHPGLYFFILKKNCTTK